jgi:hypothetical protein
MNINSSETFVDATRCAGFNLTKEPVRRKNEPSTPNLLPTAYGDYCSSRRQKRLDIFSAKGKNTIISKIKTEQHDETYDLTSFMANPAAQMLKNISKLICVSPVFFSTAF